MADEILLRFAPEELALLQEVLRIKEFPGLLPDMLHELSEEKRTEAMLIADHTLRARSFVGWNHEQRRIINPAISAILLDYANPQHTIFVDTFISAGRGIPFLYAFGEQGIYEQCQPEPDVLQLRVLPDQQELQERLTPHLTSEPLPEASNLQGHITYQTLAQGLSAIHENVEKAYLLFAGTLPSELALALTAAFHKPHIVQYIARFSNVPTPQDPLPTAALTILQSRNKVYLLWIEEPLQGDSSQVAVMVATSLLIQHYIHMVIP